VFLLTVVTLYSTIYLFFWKFQEKAISVGIPEGHVFFKFLSEQKYSLDMLFLALAIINFFILILVGIIISHRIAGPIEKLRNHLSNFHGEADDFKLRESDFFSDLGPVVNKLREKFKP
jgi:sensor histidine kinase YesM